jgi:hypothetical protein
MGWRIQLVYICLPGIHGASNDLSHDTRGTEPLRAELKIVVKNCPRDIEPYTEAK